MRRTSLLKLFFASTALFLAGCYGTVNEATTTRASTSNADGLSTAAPGGSGERTFSAYITGYSYWDNTPPGSAAIARPIIHRRAGGTGTYRDPITMAVGHEINGSNRSMDFPAGTRFYLSALRKYAIVEDLCGDGPRPQNGPCHTGYQGRPWLDIYVDGSKSQRALSEQCMNRLTRVHRVVENPGPNYPVVVGALTESGCQVFPS